MVRRAVSCYTVGMMHDDLLLTGPAPADAPACLILAHGAGAPMDSPFLDAVAQGLAARGLSVVRFEFPYMAQRRADASRRPPDRAPVLLQTWRSVIARVRTEMAPRRLLIGGKSMGGRMAVTVAAQGAAEGMPVDGVVVLGYPFHPAGRPERIGERATALASLAVPTLICQGERDALGNRATVEALPLAPAVRLLWLADGDHSLRPRKASGHTEAAHLDTAIAAIADAMTRS